MRNGGRKKKTTPRTHQFDPLELIRDVEPSLDSEAGRVVSDLYALAAVISSESFETGLQRLMHGYDASRPGIEIIAAVAEHLTPDISGLNGDVLRKAIQEAIMDAAGLEFGLDKLNVKSGLEKFLRKRGTHKFLELFLSSYVFNTVWIRVQDSLRAKNGSGSLAKSMIAIERFCTSVVSSVLEDWQADGKLEELATKKRLGSALIKTIETRLSKRPLGA